MLASANKKVFWKNQTFFNMSQNRKLVIAIMTVVAIKTIMDIKTNRLLSEIEPGIECKKVVVLR